MRRETGTYTVSTTSGETVKAFVPRPLPPSPPLDPDGEVAALIHRATLELARLNVASKMVPSPEWFLYGFVRKEAILTSQIEGTLATLTDLLAYEAEAGGAGDIGGVGGVGLGGDIKEVCNYLDALEYARAQMAAPRGLPVSLRLLRESHKRLMKGVRGESKQPGEFRRSQNWIGGARPSQAAFVPPPPEKVMECLDALEKYLDSDDALPAIVRTGLVHVQFETIHPFLDGNGRVGRLLIGLLLQKWGLLDSPLLYISLHFKRRQREYYERLDGVRTAGDWEGWTTFFLEGVASVAREATDTAGRLFALFERDRRSLLESSTASVAALKLLAALPANPIVTIARAVKLLDATKPTATKAVGQLVQRGVLKETTGRRRDRTFAYRKYLDVISEGTELAG